MSDGIRCDVCLRAAPVPGRCPACGQAMVMDDSGCRFVASYPMPPGSPGRVLGIDRIVRVLCRGTPQGIGYTPERMQAEARAELERLRRERDGDGDATRRG